MFSSTLSTIKKHYQKDIGNCNREHGFAEFKRGTPIVLARYHVNVKNLFYGYQAFLKAKESKQELDENEYDIFFGDIISQGAPAETIVCATLHYTFQISQLEQKLHSASDLGSEEHLELKIKNLCEEWGISIHSVLQFVVLEYLNNTNTLDHTDNPTSLKSSTAKINWENFIKVLLSFKADPNYQSNTYHQVLPQDQWICPLQEITSVFEFTLYQSNFSLKVQELADLFLQQQKQIQTQCKLKSQGLDRIIDRCIAESEGNFLSLPRWRWFENNCKDELKNFLSSRSQKLISELAKKNEFAAIDYFASQYQIDVISILLTIQARWPNPTLEYAYNSHPQLTKDFIKKNHTFALEHFAISDVLQRISIREHCEEELKLLDSMIDRYGIELRSHLLEKLSQISKGKGWTENHIFAYVENRFPEDLRIYLSTHRNNLLTEALNRSDIKALIKLDLKGIDKSTMERIMVLIYVNSNPDHEKYSRTNILTMKLFQKLEKDNLELMIENEIFYCRYEYSYLITMSHHHIEVCLHLTFVYHVEFSYLECNKPLSSDNLRRLDEFYKFKAKYVLEYIFEQQYQQDYSEKRTWGIFSQAKDNKSVIATFNNKKIIVSAEFNHLIELLKETCANQNNNFKLYEKVLTKAKSDMATNSEKLIYEFITHYRPIANPIFKHVRTRFIEEQENKISKPENHKIKMQDPPDNTRSAGPGPSQTQSRLAIGN